MTKEQLAELCHEVNRAYCRIGMEDDSQKPWAEAEPWQREAAITGVAAALGGVTSEALHEAWVAEKVAAGWVYGEVKDGTAKTHPCLVAYDALPPAQRVKDALFCAVVLACA